MFQSKGAKQNFLVSRAGLVLQQDFACFREKNGAGSTGETLEGSLKNANKLQISLVLG
jgi:hypothetical protein